MPDLPLLTDDTEPIQRPMTLREWTLAMRARAPQMLAVIDDALVSDDLRERINATVLCAAYAYGKPQQRISASVDHHESPIKIYIPDNGRGRAYPSTRD